MGSTDAERARRYRAHKRGDHSRCNPDRCNPDATEPVTATVTEPVTGNAAGQLASGGLRVPRLGVRGRWLWAELVDRGTPGPAERLLIEEACRLADRLDRLDAISNGKDRAWLTLEVGEDGTEVTVVVDKVLSEARQQQLALKQLLQELRQAGGKPDAGKEKGSIVDQLAARRAQRLAGATGS